MAELLDILDAFSTQLKVAWVVWLAWGVAQIFWYRYERRPQAGKQSAAAPARKPFVSKPAWPERQMTRLVTPDQVMPKEPVVAEDQPIDGPGRIGELDRFVADFEMNTRHRHEEPLNGEQVPFGS